MTRIEVSRSGGFAGLTRTWSVEVSPAEAEERWLPLLEETQAAHGTREEDPQPDRFSYHITITGYLEVTVSETELPDPLRELVDQVRRCTGH